MFKISPSLSCADQINMAEQVCEMEKLGISWYHVDIMDGIFVPNFAFGTDFVRVLKKNVTKPVLVHLMAIRPEKHIDLFANVGADYLAFHLEATDNPFRIAMQIHSKGMKAGVVLNPCTPVERLETLLDYIDTVTLMSIEPGFVRQKFMEFTYKRISMLKDMIHKKGVNVTIEIDGGIDEENGRLCIQNGADVLVGGYFSIFKQGKSITENYNEFIKYIISSRELGDLR